MSRSIRGFRWAAGLLAGVATTMLVSGCGAGQLAETAKKQPSVPGLNVVTPDGRYKIRNLYVAFNSPKGYPAGGNAPLIVALANDTDKPVTVTVSTNDANSVVLAGGSAAPAPSATGTPSAPSASVNLTPSGPSASVTATPSGPSMSVTATPSGPSMSASGAPPASPSGSRSGQPGLSLAPPPAGGPARIRVPAHDLVVLNSRSGRQLQIIGLKAPLQPGQAINLVFTFDGQQVPVQAPVTTPLTPVPPASPVVEVHAS